MDIIQSKGIGGFKLGLNITEYADLLKKEYLLNKLRYELIDIYSAKYSFNRLFIDVFIDVRTGSIYKISVTQGNDASFMGSIKLGSLAKDVFNLGLDFYYDECDEMLLSKNIKGISMEFLEDDPNSEMVPKLKITKISVFNYNITINGFIRIPVN